MESFSHQIIRGDSRDMLSVTERSVQLVVTSPPYWQLKDYGTSEQIGFYHDYETYINHLNLVWAECYRILEPGCRLCVNIGDQFARAATYGRYKVIPIRSEIIRCCEALGFDYMGAIIWQKRTTTNTTGGASLMGSYPTPRNGVISIDYEFILLFKKLGKARKVDPEIKAKSKMTKEEWKSFFAGHWHFGGARQSGHIAMFPEELPKRLIKMFSFYGETVLDPFAGSGTTSLAAMHQGRSSIGYEINEAFIPIIEEKLAGSPEGHTVSYMRDEIHINKSLSGLPYVFKDPHQLQQKVDPRAVDYGSVVDEKQQSTIEYHTIDEIVSPAEIRLKSGSLITLIGIKIKPTKVEEALLFLHKKTNKQKIYLKEDISIADADQYKYVYLKNKTFINAHLIKHGYADVDESYEYQNRQKFIKLWRKSQETN